MYLVFKKVAIIYFIKKKKIIILLLQRIPIKIIISSG